MFGGSVGGGKHDNAEPVVLKGESWFDIIAKSDSGERVRFNSVRPIHLSEALRNQIHDFNGEIRRLQLKDVNVFVNFPRQLNICKDKKRVWPEIGNCKRLLNEEFQSRPMEVWE